MRVKGRDQAQRTGNSWGQSCVGKMELAGRLDAGSVRTPWSWLLLTSLCLYQTIH